MEISQSKGFEESNKLSGTKKFGFVVVILLVFLIIQYFIFPFEAYEGTRYFTHNTNAADFTLVDAGQMQFKALIPWLTLSPWILYARTILSTDDTGPFGPFLISLIGSAFFLFIGLIIFRLWIKRGKTLRIIILAGLLFAIIISYAYGKNFYDTNYYKRDIVYAESLQKLKTISGKEQPFPSKTRMFFIGGSALTYDKEKNPVEITLEYGGNPDLLDDIRLNLEFLPKSEPPISPQLCKSFYNTDAQSKVNIVETELVKQSIYYCKTDQGIFHYIGFLDSERTISFFYGIPGGQLDREAEIKQMVMEFLNYYLAK